jgi:hypothetical protein
MWFITGIVLGALLLGLFVYLKSKNIMLNWYEWLIGIVGLVLLILTAQNFFGLFAEFEPAAAWKFLLVIGLPALILLAVAWQLAARRNKAA